MHVIHTRNAHCALPELCYQMQRQGIRRESRNGPVIRIPGPCTIQYDRPRERVVFWPQRDANPFFHLLESLWMLDGRNDLDFPASIVSSMARYSDDGHTLHGAYGHRWRAHFGMNQLSAIAKALAKDPDDRRQVLQMWDARVDLGRQGRDIPCNTHAYLSRDETGALDLMVCNRSNDSVWGALGANCVHLSFMQELVAGLIGCPVGRYWQVSNNMHLYLNEHQSLMAELGERAFPSTFSDPYEEGSVDVTPLLPRGDAAKFLSDLNMFLENGLALGITDPFIRKVAAPMAAALYEMKEGKVPGKYDAAIEHLKEMPEKCDWQIAAVEWVERRRTAWEEKKHGAL